MTFLDIFLTILQVACLNFSVDGQILSQKSGGYDKSGLIKATK